MAELLVITISKGAGDEQYQPGDVVTAQPDGYAWGKGEGPPIFKVIAKPKLLLAEAQKLCQPDIDTNFDVVRKRSYKYESSIDMLTLKQTNEKQVLSNDTEVRI